MDRRLFIRTATTGALAGAMLGSGHASAGQAGATPQFAGAAAGDASAGSKFQIGMVIYDRMTNLDFVGPCDTFARVPMAQVHVLAKTRDPITTDSNHRVLADMTLDEAPELDMIFIGGGLGCGAMMEDPEVLDFLRTRAPRAKWVTSVCTGALVLGAAGLLKGYKAATHWAAMDILPVLGAIPTHQRVVIDRNRITGGGVTAGIDFGLTLVSTVWGPELAQMIQLGEEYDPQPPFNAGSPNAAPPAVVQRYRSLTARLTATRVAAARRAMARNA